jgi:hypothetical protein
MILSSHSPYKYYTIYAIGVKGLYTFGIYRRSILIKLFGYSICSPVYIGRKRKYNCIYVAAGVHRWTR